MKILVTGREGQLVRSLVERATAFSDIVVATVGRPEVDLAEPGTLGDYIAQSDAQLVVNAAAYTAVDQAEDEPELAFRINADAPGEAAAAAARIGAPIVHLSTDYVFDGHATTPIDEDRTVAPLGVYGATKLAGEQQVQAAHPDHVILRTAWVISPFGRNFVRSMLAAAHTRPDLRVVADQRGSPTSALDLADAILVLGRLIASGEAGLTGHTFHLGGSGEASWYDLAGACMEEAARCGLPTATVQPISTEEWPTRAARPAYSVLDSRRFASATGFVMPDWRQSLPTIVERLGDKQ